VQRRKTAPKGAATFVAHCLTHDRFILSQNHGSETTAELLGAKDDRAVRAMVSDPSTNTDARAQVIALAVVLGAMEARLCGVSRYVHCSLAVPRLVGRVLGTGCLLTDLPANGGRRAEAGSSCAGLRRMTVLGGLRISA
jgi:hypothetical protein